MGLLDAILGRSRQPPPDLDRLFAVPAAAVTLQSVTGLRPTGTGSVCFRAAEGAGFAALEREIDRLLTLDGGRYRTERDDYGYTWLVRTTDPTALADLVTDLHGVNTSLADAGFGSALLCTVIGFADADRRVGLVYLYKRGTWYPFAPRGERDRDSALELQVRSALGSDLPVEPDLERWFPVYGTPGL